MDTQTLMRFPRLYAAASLKLRPGRRGGAGDLRFPRLYAAASLKQQISGDLLTYGNAVFRGFMPRPH